MDDSKKNAGPWRVMLSSTFRDLKDHRKVVLDTMPSYDLLPVAMEYDAALPADSLISASLKKVEQSGAYVGIIGIRYGQIPDSPHNPEKLSLTELEFRLAAKLDKPTCMFLMSGNHLVPAKELHTEPGSEEKLAAFRALASKDRIYAEFDSVDDLRAKAALSLHKLQELLRETSAPVSTPVATVPDAPPDSITKAPEFYAVTDYIPGHNFVGRTKEVLLLDDWAKTDEPVLLFEAIGGMGKSMLTWHWVRADATKGRDWAGRFWYSFYERGADMSDFCAYALAYTTGRPLKEFRGRKTSALTPELIAALHAKPWLFVLDGLERVLVAYNRYDAAQAADEDVAQDPDHAGRHPEACIRPADEELLRLLSGARPSKVLITSRLMPRGLLNRAGQPLPGVKHIDLPGLDPADAERLMWDAGVRGDSTRIQQYVQRHFAGHPLVVGVIAGLVARYRPAPGNFERWADDSAGGADVDLAALDLIQRRNHILKAAFDDLTSEEQVLMVRLGLIADSVDLATIEALNPYRPDPPEKVEEPRPLERRVKFERRLERELGEAEEDRKPSLQQRIGQLRAEERAEYEREKAAYEESLRQAENWRTSPERKVESDRLLETLGDLETRGLLNWDRRQNQYDLHPVVRNYAVHCRTTAEREQIGRKVVDHFTSRADPPYESAETMADVRNGLQVVRSLIQTGNLEGAYDILSVDLTHALWYNLERYSDYLALVRPYFPDGWAQPPRGLDGLALIGVAVGAVGALGEAGRATEALAVGLNAITAAVLKKDVSSLGVCLLNQVSYLIEATHPSAAERVLLLEEELSRLDDDKEHLTKAIEQRYSYSLEVGRLADAETALEAFNHSPRPQYRGWYQPGNAEWHLVRLRSRQGRLDGALLADAMRVAKEGRNRPVIRGLHRVRGEWLSTAGRFGESEAAFEEAIAMARESGLPTASEEAQRALAQAKQGNIEPARETPERLAELEDPPEISLAELFLALGDHARAMEYAKRGYKLAWADGMPYVQWWELERCRAVLHALGEPEPQLPPYDPSKATPLPFEAEVRAFIEELKAKKKKAAQSAKSNSSDRISKTNVASPRKHPARPQG
jgi:tetratricopeptide (TPR) repeat protein